LLSNYGEISRGRVNPFRQEDAQQAGTYVMCRRTAPQRAARLLRLAGAMVPGSFAEQFRKYFGSQNLPRPLNIGSPTRARTWDLRINRPALSWDRISNQALATHAKFQEQRCTALD
jgi:hypothetical protein